MFFRKTAFLIGILFIFYGYESFAATIVAEDEEVVIQAGETVEQEASDNQIQPPQQGISIPETGTKSQPVKNKTGGVAKKKNQNFSKEQQKETKQEPQEKTDEDMGEDGELKPQSHEGTVSKNQLPGYYLGGIQQPEVSTNQVISDNAGIYHNQKTNQKQIKEEQSITNQENSNKQSNKQLNNLGTKKQWKAKGEGRALLFGFLGIYGTILLVGFLFLCKKGGAKKMKKLLQKVINCVLLACCIVMGSSMVGSVVQANTGSDSVAVQNETNVTSVSENEGQIQELFSFDWKNRSDEELDHILGITDFETTGYWLKSLSEAELKEVLEKETVLTKEMSLVSYEANADGELEETSTEEGLIYYEYCMSLATGLAKAQKFQHSSGYYDYKFTMGSAVSHYRMKISGLDTSVENKKAQSAKVAVVVITQAHGNFANFSSKTGGYNHASGQSTKKMSNDFDRTGNYYILNAEFAFTKPAGYGVSLTRENYHSGHGNVYYYDSGAYAKNQRKFTSDTNTGVSVTEQLVAHTNLYTNTTVGGSSEKAPDTPICYHFQFTPVTYGVQYYGNGATSGAVSNQVCTYGNTYYVQNNGFSREYTVTYNGNGGSADKASDIAKYTFKGWGWFDTTKVTHVNGQAFSNLGKTSDYVGKFYAIWDSASVTLPSATRNGYIFNGWGNADTATLGQAAKTSLVPTKNTILYATWKPITYKIEFKDGYSGAIKGNQTLNYEQKVALNTSQSMNVTRPGYTFTGWRSSLGSYTDGQTVSNLTNQNNGIVTLTAEWKANNDTPYTVVHKLQNPSNVTEYITWETETMKGTTDSVITPDTKEYEGYKAPMKKTTTIAGDGSTEVIYLYAIQELGSLTYTVEHYLQDKNDKTKYILDQKNIQIFHAKEGEQVTPDIITSYKGYNIPNPQTITVTANKKNVVKYYYTLSESGSTTNVTNITNNGDVNNFKPGDIKYYKDAQGNEYEIFVNQDGTLTIRSVKLQEKQQENLKISGTLMINNIKYQVTEIAPYAFKNNKTIKTVKIGNGITKIGKGAFEGCTNLKTVKFGVGLSEIGARAFYGCISLEKVKTTRTLTSIGSKAFYNCKKLKSYSIGKYVKKIGSYAFYNCKKLKKITLSESVEIVEKKAFFKCSGLKKVSIKTMKLIKVGNGAFKKCGKGLKFTVPAKKKNTYAKLLKGKS